MPDTPWPDAPKGTKVTAVIIPISGVAHQDSRCGGIVQVCRGRACNVVEEPIKGTRQRLGKREAAVAGDGHGRRCRVVGNGKRARGCCYLNRVSI